MIDRYGRGHAPSPDTVVAWFALGVVPNGWSTAMTARRCGNWPVWPVWTGVTHVRSPASFLMRLSDAGAAPPATYAAAASNVFRQMAEQCLSGRVDERRIAQKIEDIVGLAGFDEDACDLPLGRLYDVSD